MKENETAKAKRAPRRTQPLAQASACRLVIFKAPRIFVLRSIDFFCQSLDYPSDTFTVTNETRIRKEALDLKGHIVRFEPVRPHSQPFILASTLPPLPEEPTRLQYPGIPLANEELLKAEEAGRIELRNFDLEFRCKKGM
jgi:hypothetical protein